MARSIYVPQTGGFVQFKDTATDAEIVSYLKSKYTAPAPAAPPPPEAPAGPDESGVLGRAAYGFATGFTDIPGGIASLFMPAEQVAETGAGQFSDAARKYLEETFGIDPTKDPTTAQQAAQILGNVGSFLVPGAGAAKTASLLGKGAKAISAAKTAGTATAAAQGVALGAAGREQAIQQQLASGMEISPEDQLAAQRLSGLIGASEALPIGRFFGPLTTILSKVPVSKAPVVEQILKSRLASITKAGAAEGAQEVASGIANDLVEYGVYNPDVEIGQDLFSNAAGGAFAGSFIEGVIQIAAGRKLRPYRQLEEDLRTESQQNFLDTKRGTVANAAERLRQFNVEGPVEVVEEEIDNVPTVTIKTKGGNIVGSLPDIESANQAIDLYQKRTGANVRIAQPPKGPSVFPIKIGGQSFNSMDDIIATQSAIRDQFTATNEFLTDPEAINRNAKLKGVAPDFYRKEVQKDAGKMAVKLEKLDEFVRAAAPKPPEPVAAADIGGGVMEGIRKRGIAGLSPAKIASISEAKPIGEPPVKPGKIRVYHSGSAGEGESGRWVSTNKKYASDYRRDLPLFYTDIPDTDSRVTPDKFNPEQTAQQGFTFNFELTPEEATSLKPIQRDEAATEPVGAVIEPEVSQPIGAVEPAPAASVGGIGAILEPEAAPVSIEEPLASKTGPTPVPVEETAPPPPRVDTAGKKLIGRLPGEARAVTPQQAIAKVMEPRQYTPEQKAYNDKLYGELRKRLDTIATPAVELELKEMIDTLPGYLVRGNVKKDNTPNGTVVIVELSKGIFDPSKTIDDNVNALLDVLNHEAIHVLRNQLRPIEWQALSRAVQNTKVPGKKYTYLDKAEAVYTRLGLDADGIVEEAVAEMYKDWVRNRTAPAQTRGPFNRITEFLRRIFRVLKSTAHEDVFKSIEAGEVRGREISNIVSPSTMYSAAPLPVAAPGQPLTNDLNDRNGKAFGLFPYLRTASPRYYDHGRLILGSTNPGNAAAQIANLDALLARHPNTLASREAFADYLADAQGKMATPQSGVPIVPYKAVKFANDPSLVARQIGRLTPGQLAMADSGLSAALDLKKAYMSGTATPVHTAKLILWGILSRGVSPFVQESMFLDVVAPRGLSNRTGRMAGGIDPFIIDAVEGNFDLDAYMDYVKTLKIDGLPGAGTTHNLGAFGKTTLIKLQQRVPDGRTLLQYLHDLISDYSLSGKEVRRKFHEVNTGIGINNKVLSFALLVSGRDDVLVLDRVQMRNQFNDGNFNDYNLYDGVKVERPVLDENGNPVLDKKGNPKIDSVAETGTGIAPIGDGVFGLMYYEALERDLANSVQQAYNMLGRGNQFSMGRYHWESWVASSAQEVDHGSVSGLIKDALGENDPYGGVYTGEGKYDTYNSGIKYGYTKDGEAYVALPDGLGNHYYFTPEYAKKVVSGYDKRSTGIISDPTFKVSESTQGAWYDRPEVNKQNLRRYLLRHRDAFAEQRRLGAQSAVRGAGKGDTTGTGPGPVHAVGRRGGVRQPQVGDVKTTAQSIADKYISKSGETVKFSAAPANPEEFSRWFKNSKAVNLDGTPQRWLHGTPYTFGKFGRGRSGSLKGQEGPFYFTRNPKIANQYAESKLHAGGGGKTVKSGSRVIPVYLSVQRPFDYEELSDRETLARQLAKNRGMNEEETRRHVWFVSNALEKLQLGDWNLIESPEYQRAIRDAGFDGFYLFEVEKNLAAYSPTQVKSIFNEFEPGAATSEKFSAAPLPAYIETKNDTLFAKHDKVSFPRLIFDFLFKPQADVRTIRTQSYGDIEIKKWTQIGLAGRAAIVDRNAAVTFLEKLLNQKTTGNFERMTADYSATAAMAWRNRSSHITAAMIRMGKLDIKFARPGDIQSATMAVTEDSDNLLNVVKVLMEPGPVDSRTNEQKDKREVFKSYAVAMRAKNKKAAGLSTPNEVDDTYIREAISTTEQNYPEVVEAYKMYQRFNKKLLESAVKAGLIKQTELNNLTRDMDYYGFYHEVYDTAMVPGMSTKTASQFKLRPYKGSQYGNLLNDPVAMMIHNSQFWVDSIAKNLAATKAFEVARQMGEARLLQTGEDPREDRGEAQQVMFYKKDGVQMRFAVKDPLLVTALGSDDRIDMGGFMKVLGLPTQFIRESVTRDPGFMVANLLRDTLSSWITSGEDITPFLGTMRGFKKALKKESSFQALMGRGVVGSYDLAMLPPAELAAKIGRIATPKNVHIVPNLETGAGAAIALWDRLGALSEASDAATRIAVYESAINQGMSEAEAAFRAIEIMDFSRRGGSAVLGVLTKLIPFLNARIQGLDVLYQAGRAGIRVATGKAMGEKDANLGKKFLVRGGMLAALSMVLEMWNTDDEDYENLDEYIKTGNLLIPLNWLGMKGEFLAIPKPFEAGLLFSTFPQQFYRTMAGEASTRENLNLFTTQFAATFGVNWVPQALLPAAEVWWNIDFYTGLPLISEGKARLAPELQYNSGTSTLSLLLGKIPVKYNLTTGKFEGVSPIVIENLIEGYTGPIGSMIVDSVGIAMDGFDVGPERLPTDLTKLPVVRRVFIDAEKKNPKVVTQAYELFQIADEANRTFSRLKQIGDVEAVRDYVEENRDILTYRKYIFKMVDGLNKMNAQERRIEADTTMTADEKREAMRKLRETRINIASKVSEMNEKLGR